MKNNLSILLALISSGANAYTVGEKTVNKAHVHTSGGYYFTTNEVMVNPDNCPGDSWYKINQSDYSKEAFAVLLSAKMTGKKVDFYLNGCTGGYPKVDWINVHD